MSSSAPRVRLSFPTRRSSDLPVAALEVLLRNQFKAHGEIVEIGPHRIANCQWITRRWDLVIKTPAGESLEAPTLFRSEEHTSELQSHHDLVCRLLLEKKNFRR